jgi:hypothetical protein
LHVLRSPSCTQQQFSCLPYQNADYKCSSQPDSWDIQWAALLESSNTQSWHTPTIVINTTAKEAANASRAHAFNHVHDKHLIPIKTAIEVTYYKTNGIQHII